MKGSLRSITRRYGLVGSAVSVCGLWAMACSGPQIAPLPPVPSPPPAYVQVPHPDGLDLGDLYAIFTERRAPSPQDLKTCDDDFRKLRKLSASKEELVEGARELVRREPVKYHWCFYGKLVLLEDQLKQDIYVDDKQKHILETYIFLSPIARAFLQEYRDSRYLRWAVTRYRRLSEYVFYRRVELSPQGTQDLVTAANPWGWVRGQKDSPQGVLEKYGLADPTEPPPSQSAPAPVSPGADPTEQPMEVGQSVHAPPPEVVKVAPAQPQLAIPAGPVPASVDPLATDPLPPADFKSF